MRCWHCQGRGQHRIDLRTRPADERLADLARKCWCRRCGPVAGRAYLSFELAMIEIDWTKRIGFTGGMAIKIGMN